MKILILLVLTSFSSAYSFHEVTEVLPDGKILICKDANQVRKGSTVEVFKRSPSRWKTEEMVKVNELTLPLEGSRISLHRQDLFRKNKLQIDSIEKMVGMAIVIDPKVEGEAIEEHSFNQKAGLVRKLETIGINDAQKIKEECLIAMPDGKWRAEVGDSVRY